MKGYLFDTVGVGIIIITILIMLIFLTMSSSYFVSTAPSNLTNQTYTQIVNSIYNSQATFPILFILMYLAIIIGSSVVQTHPAVLIISGIMLIFGMIIISVFEDIFAILLTFIPQTMIAPDFTSVINSFKTFSILTGISVIGIGIIKTAKVL